MDSRRTRRDVLCATAGLGLTVAAGCLDESEAAADETTDIERPTYLEFVLAASASRTGDHSVRSFDSVDLTALDAVSDSLPSETDEELRREAYNVVTGAKAQFGEENIDGTFSFEIYDTYENAVAVTCEGVEGSFDVDAFREEVDEDDEDLEYRSVAGFDVYTWSTSYETASTAISSDVAVRVGGFVEADDVASMLEDVESTDLEPSDELDDVLIITDRLGDGLFVSGELQPVSTGAGAVGRGASIAIDDAEATMRMVELYDDDPGAEAVEDVEGDVEAGPWSEVYDDTTVDVDGRAIVVTATVETERFEPTNY